MSNHPYTRTRREARALKTYQPHPTDAQITDYRIGGAL
jgi:hypothetical protein